MNLAGVRSIFAIFITITGLSFASANFIRGLEKKWYRIEDAAKQELQKVDVQPWRLLSPAVRHMAIDTAPQEYQKSQVADIPNGFKWKSCGAADQLVEIRNLSITPDPLFFPGILKFGFDIFFHDTIPASAKVAASLYLEFERTTGGEWVKIPCLGGIGSCNYDDVCSLSQGIQCPEKLKDLNIPCTCPFNKGEYKLDTFSVQIDASVFPSGNYHANATFTDSSKGQIACYQVWFTVG